MDKFDAAAAAVEHAASGVEDAVAFERARLGFEPDPQQALALSGARRSGEFIRKAETFVRRMGMRLRGDGDNAASILMANGSRIVGLPGNEATTRGFSAVSLLLADEAARVGDHLYRAMRPALAAVDDDQKNQAG